jgi:hypothetical protein
MRSSSISDVFGSKYEPAIKARVITTWHACSKQVQNIKLLTLKSFIFWEKFTKSIFSFILWGQNFANFHTQQTHWFFSLLDSARELQLHLCNSMCRVSTIPGYIKTYCCFVLRAICGAEICSVLITFRREGGGIILVMRYYDCKTPR